MNEIGLRLKMVPVPEGFREICQPELPVYPWLDPVLNKLPGLRPVESRDWLIRDAVFNRQMAYRDWLIAHRRGAVVAAEEEARPAAKELLKTLLEHLADADGYSGSADSVTRPDGVRVELGGDDPMAVIGRLAQEDFCLLERRGSEHDLTAAVLCFPASWTLAEKIGRPLGRMHRPVTAYTNDMAARIQRMFDRMQPGTLMMRANALVYDDPDLHQPRTEAAPKQLTGPDRWVRVERQTLCKLPKTGAVVFGIHSYVVPVDSVPREARAQFDMLA